MQCSVPVTHTLYQSSLNTGTGTRSVIQYQHCTPAGGLETVCYVVYADVQYAVPSTCSCVSMSYITYDIAYSTHHVGSTTFSEIGTVRYACTSAQPYGFKYCTWYQVLVLCTCWSTILPYYHVNITWYSTILCLAI